MCFVLKSGNLFNPVFNFCTVKQTEISLWYITATFYKLREINKMTRFYNDKAVYFHLSRCRIKSVSSDELAKLNTWANDMNANKHIFLSEAVAMIVTSNKTCV